MTEQNTVSQQYLFDKEELLAKKVKKVYGGDLAVDKRRLPASQLQKKGVPAYVGEWILENVVPGDGDLSSEDAAKVQEWAAKLIPGPGDSNRIRNSLLNVEIATVLTPVSVEVVLTKKRQERMAKMNLLGISDAFIADSIVEKNKDLLNQGMWGVTQLVNTPEGVSLGNFKPMQASIDIDIYKEYRKEFTLSEWRALMLNSMGYNPNAFTEEEHLLLLCRLLPLVQKNMHMIELAPKGTG